MAKISSKFKPRRVLQSAWEFFGREPSEPEISESQQPSQAPQKVYTDPPILLYAFHENEYTEEKIASLDELFKILDEKRSIYTCWIDIEGTGNADFIQKLGNYFKMHELEMEDMANLHQRPKVEEYENHLFVVSRMIYYTSKDLLLTNEQVSFFIYRDCLVTVQEENEDAFEPVREKLRKNKANIRHADTFHIAWALMDAIVDNYFPMLEDIGDQLDHIEDELFYKPTKSHLNEIQAVKREVFFLRKAIWAERDKISELVRSSFFLVDEKTRLYLRDTYDHTVQIIDIIESHKEISYSLMEVYLSTQNNRLSEVMKVLTVISSIFIPLTFIVGVYGMNFSPQDKHGNAAPFNMPELYHPYGYAAVMGVMLLIGIVQIIYFRRRGWLR